MSERESDALVQASRLSRDIDIDQRDAMYRAMSFIASHGGPPAPSDTKAALIAHRSSARAWLLAHEKRVDLLSAYERFVETWSPVFSE